MNVSYGLCELFNGTSGNAMYNTLWQTAATAGIAVFVASGDAGSALCDDGSDNQYGTPWSAQYGLAVNGLASTQYDTAVGGTDFNWGSSPTTYWAASNSSTTGANALGYVPEVPWNDTCTNPLALSTLEAYAGDVKYTGKTVIDAETACEFIATDSISVFQNYTSGGEPRALRLENAPADMPSPPGKLASPRLTVGVIFRTSLSSLPTAFSAARI
jgi:hypothetical protein